MKLFFFLFISSLLHVNAATFSDDFSTNTTANYSTIGSGTLTYNETDQRVCVTTAGDTDLSFSHALSAPSDTGVFSIDLSTLQRTGTVGEIELRLFDSAGNNYKIIDRIGGTKAGGLTKYIGGARVDYAWFKQKYEENKDYKIKVTYSPSATEVEAFGQMLTIDTNDAAIKVSSFTLKTKHQNACYDNIVSTTDTLPPENTAPTAHAGVDKSVTTGSTVTLDGSRSSDADRDALVYEWSITEMPEGSTAILSDPTAEKPTFTADVDGKYVIRLITNDGIVDSASDSVSITAVPPFSGSGFSDDFSTDTTVDYATNGSGILTYDETNARVCVTTAGNTNLSFSHALSAPSDTGVFSIDLSTLQRTGTVGEIELRLFDNAGNNYKIIDRIGGSRTGGITKYIGGSRVDYAWFRQKYEENRDYKIKVTYSPSATEVEAFGQMLTIDTNDAAIKVSSFTLKTKHQNACYDNIVSTTEEEELDTTPPNITLNGENPMTVIQDDAFSDPGAVGTDDVDGNIPVTKSGTVDTSTVGSYTITYSTTDIAGNTATITRTVNVVLPEDTNPPNIMLNGDSDVTLVQGDSYTEAGATATDDRDGSLAVTISGTVDTSAVGIYTLTYTATDSAGNTATVIRTVNIIAAPILDATPPVITVLGNDPISVVQGSVYTDAGATATDDIDGPVSVTSSGTVDTSTVGSYTITFTAQDTAGNTATKTRTVNVVLPPDTTPPIITLNGDNPMEVIQGDSYVEAGATATDDRDGSVSVTTTGTVDVNTVGTYTITYMATDNASNSASTSRIVNVVLPPDTGAPVITVNGASTIEVVQNGTYMELGATATDNVDGTVSVTVSGSVDTSTVGSYTITYMATDSAGNTATKSRMVNVVLPADTTPPVITLNGDITVMLTQGDSYTEAGATATDDRDGNLAVTISGTVDTSTVGSYILTYSATDNATNTATVSRTVNVVLPADTTPPVITVLSYSPTNVVQDSVYTDAGATATDNVDGSISVTSSGSVDTSVVEVYTITYSATDNAGNTATATRTVNVTAAEGDKTCRDDNNECPVCINDDILAYHIDGSGYCTEKKNVAETIIHKELDRNDVTVDEFGYKIANNVIRILLKDDQQVNYEIFKSEILQDYNAELLNEYVGIAFVIRFYENKTDEEIEIILDSLRQERDIEACDRVVVDAFTIDAILPDDPWGDVAEDTQPDWDESNTEGRNWGLKAHKIVSAWEYNNFLDSVNIGVVDGGFQNHIDLAGKTQPVEFDYASINVDPKLDPVKNRNHGTHTSGTIAADFNNARGITGILKKVNLLTDNYFKNGIDSFQYMIRKDRDVINYSMGIELGYAELNKVQEGDLDLSTYGSIKTMARSIVNLTSKLNAANKLDDVDFCSSKRTIIVQSAGNQQINTLYGSAFAHMKSIDCEDNIVIVGAIDQDKKISKWETKFPLTGEEVLGFPTVWVIASGSNYGDQVDIYAAGTDIYSSILFSSYGNKNGTSMAAPHITGILGMIYGANYALNATQAKGILLKGADLGGLTVTDPDGNIRPIANAKKSVELALYSNKLVGTYADSKEIVLEIDPLTMTLKGKYVDSNNRIINFNGPFILNEDGSIIGSILETLKINTEADRLTMEGGLSIAETSFDVVLNKCRTSQSPACPVCTDSQILAFEADALGEAYCKTVDVVYAPEKLLFVFADAEGGNEPWITDGILGGTTQRLKDIRQYESDSITDSFNPILMNNIHYFNAYTDGYGYRIWKSDGTESGTVMLKDIAQSQRDGMCVVNNILYFNGDDDDIYGQELWRSDGTEAGTFMVKNINGMYSSYPNNLVAMNNILYFSARDGTHSDELWRSDGTEAGTFMVKDIRSGAGGSDIDNLVVANNILYFSALDGLNGEGLWRSDGTEAGTFMVKDIREGTYSPNLKSFVVANNILYFSATDGLNGQELWRSDGTEAGTFMVKDIKDGTDNAYPYSFFLFNGIVYFSAYTDEYGRELWRSDGTEAGTFMVKDIGNGIDGSYPNNLVSVNNTLYFSASQSNGVYELWKSDGTEVGTEVLGSFTGSVFHINGSANGNLVFSIFNEGTLQLWKSDGTVSGTLKLLETQVIGRYVYELLPI